MQKVEGSNPFSRFAGSGSSEPQVRIDRVDAQMVREPGDGP